MGVLTNSVWHSENGMKLCSSKKQSVQSLYEVMHYFYTNSHVEIVFVSIKNLMKVRMMNTVQAILLNGYYLQFFHQQLLNFPKTSSAIFFQLD